MFKKILFLIAVLHSWAAFAQPDLLFPLESEFRWRDIEKQNATLKAKFIDALPNDLDYFKEVDDYRSKLDSCLHIIDFNNDGLDDIVFSGWGGAEPDMIAIYINNGKSFDRIFLDYQGIYKVVLHDKKIIKLYIQDWGCCCEYIVKNKVFTVNYDSIVPKVELFNQMQYIRGTDLPKNYYDKPMKFKVLNDNYAIRFSPLIDDTTEIGYCGELRKGNSLGKVPSGSIGFALSERVDPTGRIWWFVALQPDVKIAESLFLDIKGDPKSYKLGWVSSRYLKKTEN